VSEDMKQFATGDSIPTCGMFVAGCTTSPEISTIRHLSKLKQLLEKSTPTSALTQLLLHLATAPDGSAYRREPGANGSRTSNDTGAA